MGHDYPPDWTHERREQQRFMAPSRSGLATRRMRTKSLTRDLEVGLGRFCCSMHYQCRTSVRDIVEGSSAIAIKLVSTSMTFFFLGMCWNRRSKIHRPGSHARTKNPPLARSKYSWIRPSWPAACSLRWRPARSVSPVAFVIFFLLHELAALVLDRDAPSSLRPYKISRWPP
jgi:hypothetical protein